MSRSFANTLDERATTRDLPLHVALRPVLRSLCLCLFQPLPFYKLFYYLNQMTHKKNMLHNGEDDLQQGTTTR